VDQPHQGRRVGRLESIEHPAPDQVVQDLAMDEPRDPDHRDLMVGMAIRSPADPAFSSRLDVVSILAL
jgi:hypothetical protein